MARIGGVDIPRDKQIQFSLPYVYGIGRATAVKICEQTSISPEASGVKPHTATASRVPSNQN